MKILAKLTKFQKEKKAECEFERSEWYLVLFVHPNVSVFFYESYFFEEYQMFVPLSQECYKLILAVPMHPPTLD